MDLFKKASPAGDDIIDLTDIIEQGPVDSFAKLNAEQQMDAQMDTLFSKGNKEAQQLLPSGMDDDIDALLAEMEAGSGDANSAPETAADTAPETGPASPPSAAPAADKGSAPVLNPDETLDMPNMSEVDALLEGLDIPPQPTDTSATPTPDAISDDIDSLLGDMLNGASKSSPVPAPDSAPADSSAEDMTDDLDALPIDLDALLAEAAVEIDSPPPAPKAAPKAAANLSLDDIDALLAAESAPKADAPAPAKAAPKAAANLSLDDIDALLAAESAPKADVPAPAKAAPKAAANLSLDDIDALLAAESAPKADAPAPAKAAPKAAASPSLDDDIDALLAAESAPKADAHKGDLSFDEELDSLLAAAAAPPASKAARTTSAEAIPSLEDDLDTLFATVSPQSTTKAGHAHDAAPEAPPADAGAEDNTPIDLSDLDDTDTNIPEDAEKLVDIIVPNKGAKAASSPVDDLLAGLDLAIDPTASSTALEDTPTKASTETFDEIDTLMADVAGQNAPNAAPPMDIAMVSMADMTDMPAMPPSNAKGVDDLPELEALDALLDAANSTAPAADNLPNISATMTDLDLASDSDLPDVHVEETDVAFTDEEIAQAAQELYDEKILAEATTGDVDTNAWLESLDEALMDAEDTGKSKTPGNTPKADGESAAVLPAPTTFAGSPDPMAEPDNIDQLLAHLPEDAENTHYVYRPGAEEEGVSATAAQNHRGNDQNRAAANSPFEKAYEQELARLQHITDRFAQSLAAADMHIAALTNTTTNAVPPLRGLDDILCHDSPFNTNLQTLVRNAVSSELKAGVRAPDSAPAQALTGSPVASASETRAGAEGMDEVQQRLDSLHAQMQNLHERISALEDGNKEARLQTVETRVDGQVKTIIHLEERCKILEAHLEAQAKSQSNLENRFQHEVEKAAAAAAAKIIREEIAGILAGN